MKSTSIRQYSKWLRIIETPVLIHVLLHTAAMAKQAEIIGEVITAAKQFYIWLILSYNNLLNYL